MSVLIWVRTVRKVISRQQKSPLARKELSTEKMSNDKQIICLNKKLNFYKYLMIVLMFKVPLNNITVLSGRFPVLLG